MIIKNKNQLNFYIQSDRIMAGIDSPITFKERLKNQFLRIIKAGGTRDIIIYLRYLRLFNYYSNLPKKNILDKMVAAYYNYRYSQYGIKLGFSIHPNSFGYALHIPHFGSVIVNSNSDIGNFSFLNAGSCIGGKKKKIGDGLYMGTGSQIQGHDISIGDYVSISAMSIVTKDIIEGKSNLLITGVPATIKNDGQQEWWNYLPDPKWKLRVKKVLDLKQLMGVIE